MDALEFTKELQRMCDSHPHGCGRCDLCGVSGGHLCGVENLEKAIPIVEKWSKEHPIVRNVDHVAEGLEKLGYKVNKEKIAQDCPPQYNTLHSWSKKSCPLNCEECGKWWLEEYKGEDINVPSKGVEK